MISLIIPDDCRPWYEDANGVKHYADIVSNPASIVGRKNLSQLDEALLSRCIDKIVDMTNACTTDDEFTKVLDLIHELYGAQHKDLDIEGLKAMKESGRVAFKMNVGTFHENSYDFVMNIAKKLGVTETEEVYAPSVCIRENLEFTEESKLSGIEVVNIETEDGDIDSNKELEGGTSFYLGWLDTPLVIGVNYYYKLYHSAVWSGSVTPARTGKVASPMLGQGKVRKTGQSISEIKC